MQLKLLFFMCCTFDTINLSPDGYLNLGNKQTSSFELVCWYGMIKRYDAVFRCKQNTCYTHDASGAITVKDP